MNAKGFNLLSLFIRSRHKIAISWSTWKIQFSGCLQKNSTAFVQAARLKLQLPGPLRNTSTRQCQLSMQWRLPTCIICYSQNCKQKTNKQNKQINGKCLSKQDVYVCLWFDCHSFCAVNGPRQRASSSANLDLSALRDKRRESWSKKWIPQFAFSV